MGPERIKRLRTLLGWSQERLARDLGVSFSTVNRWERGKTSPSPMAVCGLERLETVSRPSENRRGFRLNVRCPILVEALGHGAADSPMRRLPVFEATTDNLGFSGLMFKAPAEVTKGERLRIGLDYKKGRDNPEGAGGDERIEALSKVAWTSGKGIDKRIGVHFETSMPEEMSMVMNALIVH